jgi:hypothetical protein
MTQVTPEPSPSAPGHDATDGDMSLVGLADDRPAKRFDRILQWIPRILSSKPHVVLLVLLGLYLVVLPLFGIVVSQKSELIGGNYTNVTSDIGACIAAGGTLHLISQGRRRLRAEEERTRILRDIHDKIHQIHLHAMADIGRTPSAAEIGRTLPPPADAGGAPPPPAEPDPGPPPRESV